MTTQRKRLLGWAGFGMACGILLSMGAGYLIEGQLVSALIIVGALCGLKAGMMTVERIEHDLLYQKVTDE